MLRGTCKQKAPQLRISLAPFSSHILSLQLLDRCGAEIIFFGFPRIYSRIAGTVFGMLLCIDPCERHANQPSARVQNLMKGTRNDFPWRTAPPNHEDDAGQVGQGKRVRDGRYRRCVEYHEVVGFRAPHEQSLHGFRGEEILRTVDPPKAGRDYIGARFRIALDALLQRSEETT